MAVLYIIATPIGNLEDLSFRASRVLKEADLILAEDTRITRKLLARYQIKTPLASYHQHSRLEKIEYFLELLRKGKNLALVSDAGTPGISDPGNLLVSSVLKDLNGKTEIIAIPGPSALTAAASVAGFATDRFLFLGFPPVKKKRQKFFEEISGSKYPVIFYESTHRILRTLTELALFNRGRDNQNETAMPQIVVCQEMTKKFEKIYRGSINQVLVQMKKSDLRGEFVVIVSRQ